MNAIFNIIGIPILVGILLFLLPERIRMIKGLIALAVSIFTFYCSFKIYSVDWHLAKLNEIIQPAGFDSFGAGLITDSSRYLTFSIDNLSKLIILCISLFASLILLYSLVYITKEKKMNSYFAWFLITLGASYGAVLSDNLLLFLTFWGILGITLYKLIRENNEESSATAKKTLIIIGSSDGIMILGIAILWKITGTLNMSEISVPTATGLQITAFLALLIGSFTKAGAFPFHSWVPDYAKSAPAASSAYLPASLDKLLGIYFLARITSKLFIMNEWLNLLLLSIGVITIITAVMMALVQHNYKKLLGFHAVSQVGYMIVGFGLGSAIGIAAGLFHMINNALYKSGLFLSAGCIEYRTGKDEIDDLGGLSKVMPITFVASLIFALAISGVPPFNGFASKWMIYQGIIDFGKGAGIANHLWIVWLGLAVAGSALTLASFIKFMGGIFLGRRKLEYENVREVPVLMWLPITILALFCIIFGVFASNIVVPMLLKPVTGELQFAGFWNSPAVSLLVLVSILVGVMIYLIPGIKSFRTDDSFIGGETNRDETTYPTIEFYKTLGEFNFLKWMYKKAEEKWFDLYDLAKNFVLWLSHQFSNAHSGILPTYIIWAFVGLIVMMIILI